MTDKEIETIIANKLMDTEFLISSEQIVQTNGLFFRVNPKWAKDEAKLIVKVLKNLDR